MHPRHSAFFASIAAALAFLGLSLLLSYEAGCPGDAKAGLLGELGRTLNTETLAVGCAWCGVWLLALAVFKVSNGDMARRVMVTLAAATLTLAVVSYLGATIEARVVQRCLAPR
jgi:hypothetical protein